MYSGVMGLHGEADADPQTAPYRVMEFSRRIVNRTQIATKPGAGKKSKSGPSCACTKEATALLLKKAQPSL